MEQFWKGKLFWIPLEEAEGKSKVLSVSSPSLAWIGLHSISWIAALWSLIDVPPLINLSKVFRPGHSYSNPLAYIKL